MAANPSPGAAPSPARSLREQLIACGVVHTDDGYPVVAVPYALYDEVLAALAACPVSPADPAPVAKPERMFPIMGERVGERLAPIPWSVIAPHEAQARRNHDQSLERLAERGGLDPTEAIAVLGDQLYPHGKPRVDIAVADAQLRQIVAHRLAAQSPNAPVASPSVREEAEKLLSRITPGQWHLAICADDHGIVEGRSNIESAHTDVADDVADDDAVFIIAAPRLIRALLAAQPLPGGVEPPVQEEQEPISLRERDWRARPAPQEHP